MANYTSGKPKAAKLICLGAPTCQGLIPFPIILIFVLLFFYFDCLLCNIKLFVIFLRMLFKVNWILQEGFRKIKKFSSPRKLPTYPENNMLTFQ